MEFSQVVAESYRVCCEKIAGWRSHYDTDLPTDEMVAEDIVNNYEGYEHYANDPYKMTQFVDAVAIELNHLGVKYINEEDI